MKRKMINRLKRWEAEKRGEICVNCGQRGPHFIPPSLGERGRFSCQKTAKEVLGGLYTPEVDRMISSFPCPVEIDDDGIDYTFCVNGGLGRYMKAKLSKRTAYWATGDIVSIFLHRLLSSFRQSLERSYL